MDKYNSESGIWKKIAWLAFACTGKQLFILLAAILYILSNFTGCLTGPCVLEQPPTNETTSFNMYIVECEGKCEVLEINKE